MSRKTDNYYGNLGRGRISEEIAVSKFGYNKDVDSGAAETIRSNGGAFSPITTAYTLSIVSDSANDASAGTGCQYIRIDGLDANYNVIVEDIATDGVTPVVTTNAFIAVNRCVGILFGSGTTNAGNITITQTTGGAVMAYIVAGVGITQQLIYTVPAGYKAQLKLLKLGGIKPSGGASPRVRFLYYTYVPESNGTYLTIDETIDTSVTNEFILEPPFANEIAQKSTIWINASTSQDNTEVYGRFYLHAYKYL